MEHDHFYVQIWSFIIVSWEKNRTYWTFIHDHGGFSSARFDCQMVPPLLKPQAASIYLYIYISIHIYIYVIIYICNYMWSIMVHMYRHLPAKWQYVPARLERVRNKACLPCGSDCSGHSPFLFRTSFLSRQFSVTSWHHWYITINFSLQS